jgi:hypothetical protein
MARSRRGEIVLARVVCRTCGAEDARVTCRQEVEKATMGTPHSVPLLAALLAPLVVAAFLAAFAECEWRSSSDAIARVSAPKGALSRILQPGLGAEFDARPSPEDYLKLKAGGAQSGLFATCTGAYPEGAATQRRSVDVALAGQDRMLLCTHHLPSLLQAYVQHGEALEPYCAAKLDSGTVVGLRCPDVAPLPEFGQAVSRERSPVLHPPGAHFPVINYRFRRVRVLAGGAAAPPQQLALTADGRAAFLWQVVRDEMLTLGYAPPGPRGASQDAGSMD